MLVRQTIRLQRWSASASVSKCSSRSMATPAEPSRLRLPRLPVPPLRDTLNRYLKSIEPLLLEDEAHGGPPAVESMRTRADWADEFESGLGKLCQERLQGLSTLSHVTCGHDSLTECLAIDKASPYNWLDDNFWLNKAYLEWRAPLLINSNWWLVYMHDPSISTSTPPEAELRAGISAKQVRRAAWLLKRTLDFKERLES